MTKLDAEKGCPKCGYAHPLICPLDESFIVGKSERGRMAQATAEISDDRLAKALETVIGKGIEGVWLRRTGGEDGHGVEVLVQMDGDWFVAIQEDLRANFSHATYLAGSHNWPLAFPEESEKS